MQYVFKAIIATSIMIEMMTSNTITSKDIIIFLLVLTLTLLVGELKGKVQQLFILIEIIVMIMAMKLGLSLNVLAFIAFDVIYSENYFHLGFLFMGLWYYFNHPLKFIEAQGVGVSLSFFCGYLLRRASARNLFYKNALDGERRMRYELETTKNQLILSNQKIEALTQAKERNRIARDLHDSLGHSIAAILIQMQAGLKILKKDQDKAETILSNCVVKTQDTLEMIRKTVHDMYTIEKPGIAMIKEIINEFNFCRIESHYNGDFSGIQTHSIQIISYILKEALTNTIKHSEATLIHFELTASSKLLRLFIQDNGKGSAHIVEGLGIKSMRDRMNSINGVFSIDGKEGLRIVCTIPLEGGSYEATDSR